MANLINNQTGGANQGIQARSSFSCLARIRQFVTKLRSLKEIGLKSLLTAFIAKCLSQVRFSCPRRTNKSQIAVSIYSRKRTDIFQTFNVPAFNHREVKVFKGLWIFKRQSTHFQKSVYCWCAAMRWGIIWSISCLWTCMQACLRTSLFCFLLYQLSLWWVKYRAQPEAINP